MTPENVFRLYRAYKFFYNGNHNDFQRYINIKCPPLLDQKDRQFYYRLSQKLSDSCLHSLFNIGFFHNPKAYVSTLVTPEALTAAAVFAGRMENGEPLLKADLYELKKRLSSISDIDVWLYGEHDSTGKRAMMPGCLQDVINEELPVDLACLLLLIPQPDLSYNWLMDITPDELSLGSGPWIDRLKKIDQLIHLHRPDWRMMSYQLAKEFWHSFSISSLAPRKYLPEPALF